MENLSRKISTLSDFLKSIRDTLRKSFPETYWVSGEIAGIKTYANATYFDLLELRNGLKIAQVKVTVFAGEGLDAINTFEMTTGQQLVAGLKIGARFRVNFHEVYGMSLVLTEIDAESTLGGIELQRKAALLRLVSRYPGYIQMIDGEYRTSNKGLPIPLVIQKIAVISSANAEGYHDFIHTLENNERGIRFDTTLFATVVHGSQAATEIINAFRRVYDSGIHFDAIALIRGGGAPSDFIPYDDENLGAVIARARFPVVTGIGHHNNQGICDLLAAVHEKTPTAAAKYILNRANQYLSKIEQLAGQIMGKSTSNLSLRRLNLLQKQQQFNNEISTVLNRRTTQQKNLVQQLKSAIANRIELEKANLIQQNTLIQIQARHSLKTQQQLLNTLVAALARQPIRQIALANTDLARLKMHILSLSPQRTLERGFAIVTKNKVILTDANALNNGDEIEIRFAEVTVQTEVKQINSNDGNTFEL